MNDLSATYSPEDNKLRLYSVSRLDSETYQKVKACGFKWAPKQGFFVAPMWTPDRADLLIGLCGEIGDEDKSLVDRAEERAERFSEYEKKRAIEADSAKKYVSSIADNIPFGQPILVGHHSEKRARKDAQRIENGMRKAIQLWDTSQYWKQRAAGAIHHAKYKERPDVRARRIKGIEADKRKALKEKEQAKMFLNLWLSPVSMLSRSKALFIANHSFTSFCFPLDQYPRGPEKSQYEGDMGLWSALDHGIITARQARNLHVPVLERTIARHERWIAQYDNRLIYEKAMLDEQGASQLLDKKPRPKQLPLCNYRAPEGIMIENMYHKGEFSLYKQVDMTKAEYSAIYGDWKGTKEIENSHRVRIAILKNHDRVCVFLTDSKEHKKPEAIEKAPVIRKMQERQVYTPPEKTDFDDMKNLLRAGVQTVTAPQLFPTPPELAQKMVEYADVQSGECVLEPSAGTGNIVDAVLKSVDTEVLAYEINQELCSVMSKKFPSYKLAVRQRDFLEVTDYQGQYPKIIMNPPFENGSDIKHIKHAMTFLCPGGRLVALCANGPRQQEQLRPIVEETGGIWEDLPSGTFKNAGTMVNSALLVING